MTRILQFRISGLAGRKETLEHRFDPAINVFWGLNGAGKTSLLRMLDSALSNDASTLSKTGFESASITFFSDTWGATIERTLTRKDLDRVNETDGRIPWQTTLIQGDAETPLMGPFSRAYLPIGRQVESRAAVRTKRGISFIPDENDFGHEIERAWQIFNSRSLSRIRQIQQRGLADVLSDLFHPDTPSPSSTVLTRRDADEAYVIVSDFLERQRIPTLLSRDKFSERFLTDAALPGVVNRIRLVNEDITLATRSQESFKAVINELYSGDKRIEFRTDSTIQFMSGRRSLDLDLLSSGEKHLLKILLAALGAGPNPVMVDEPELSMHIDWQQRLVPSMQSINPDCQLILATHSPEIIGSIDRKFVFEL